MLNKKRKIPNPNFKIQNKPFLKSVFKGSCEAKTCVLDIGILILFGIWCLELVICTHFSESLNVLLSV